MESKIKIKMGQIEIEYEGSEAFLKKELPTLLGVVSDLYRENGVMNDDSEKNTPSKQEPPSNPSGIIQITTGNVAAKLGVKSGPGLILAAAARMTFSLGMPTFTRSQILDEMKTATAYHKKSYVNNLTKYLNKLVKDQKFLETGASTYALSASEKTTMESLLA